MKEQIENIKKTAIEEIAKAEDLQTLENARVKYLGKKGELTAVLRGMGGLSPEERPIIGGLVNEAKESLEKLIEEKEEKFKLEELNKHKNEKRKFTPCNKNNRRHRRLICINGI